MLISGWGKYPVIDSLENIPLTAADLRTYLNTSFMGIARGMGRSYGDSALAPHVISTTQLNHLLAFDEHSGILHCQAGVTLEDILNTFIPKGWFPPVTPGTKYVTVGGCIASDVHGKNHHLVGSFCDHVLSITVMLADGKTVICTPESNSELFRATCGGMGLTGIILDATFKMRRIPGTHMESTTYKAADLDQALTLFEQYESSTYSVAWIDCLSGGARLGRSLITVGDHSEDGDTTPAKGKHFMIPMDMPSFLLNRYSIKAFNSIYYHKIRNRGVSHRLHYDQFFYPLDKILQWNRLYGKNGFTQYQFVLPKEKGKEGMSLILKRIAASNRGSFLAVLKAFGKGNDNYLSFPMEGYTLAVDFKLNDGLLGMLNELDRIVIDHGGRIYLTKDARMSEATFKSGYPNWEAFLKMRQRVKADQRFRSLQSERLGL